MNFIARFLPSLVPGLSALANPWVLLTLLAALVGAFGFGVYLEAGRFEAFKVTVASVGKAQEQRAHDRAVLNKNLKKEADDAYKLKAGKLLAGNAALAKCLQVGAGCGFVPARQQPVGSKCPDGQVCYDAGELDAAIRKFAARTAGLVGEGETLKLKLDTGIEWVAKQRKIR